MNTEPREYIWLHRWESFQHYRPERDRPPAWIKSYTKQLRDERYLDLTDRQRALLHDLRHVFAVTFGRVPRDCAVIGRHRHRQTFRKDVEALNDAGFVVFVSRETLDQNLEALYSTSPLEVEKEKEKEEKNPLTPADAGEQTPRQQGTNPRAKTKRSKVYKAAESMVRNVGWDYTDSAYLEEIERFDLTQDQRSELDKLRTELQPHDQEPAAEPPDITHLNGHKPDLVPTGMFLDTEPEETE